MYSSLILFALIALAYGYVCPHNTDLECLAVSTDPRFVSCVNKVCACKTAFGYTGAATPQSKCSCPHGYQLVLQNSGGVNTQKRDEQDEQDSVASTLSNLLTPYCINVTDAVRAAAQERRDAILLNTISSLYNSLVYPAPAIIMEQLILNQTTGGIWDAVAIDAVGRVDPLGEFDTKDGIVEYFYGQVWTGASQVQKVVINKLLVDGNKVTVAVDMHFYIYDTWPGGNLLTNYNLTQTGVFTFNAQNQIQTLDLVIHNLGAAVNFFFADHEASAERICGTLFQIAGCDASNDPDGHYASPADCLAFLNGIDFGTWDNLRTNSVVCRQFHSILAIARPEVHCVHAGKTGGGKCVDTPYTNYYLQQFK